MENSANNSLLDCKSISFFQIPSCQSVHCISCMQGYQTTDVYANGVMQAAVWVSINYNGSTKGIESHT